MLIPISDQLIEQTIAAARGSVRRRAIYRFHEHEEAVQRMLNALEPGTYVRPHRHADPAKVECFLILRGKVACVEYDDTGMVVNHCILQPEGLCGVEIPPGTWHSLICLASGTCVYEIIEGPYLAATHKSFAAWSPPEDDEGTGQDFIADVLRLLELDKS